MNIIRVPTQAEMGDTAGDGGLIPLSLPGKERVKSPQYIFDRKIADEEKKANKLGKPFAIQALREEVKELSQTWEKRWKRRGFVDEKNDPYPKVDWSKYSDLKNFEITNEDEVLDNFLTKKQNFPVLIKSITYKFKGFPNLYTVQEPAETAIDRALEKFRNPTKGGK